MRAHLNEVHVETLVASTIFAQAFASKVLKINPPPVIARQVSCKLVLRDRRPLADSRDVVPDLGRQAVYMLVIPGRVSIRGGASGERRRFAQKQNAKSYQQGPDCHLTLQLKPQVTLRQGDLTATN
jgi:hypothetical protein